MKIRINPATMIPEIVAEPKPSKSEMLRKVRATFGIAMRVSTDGRVLELISDVSKGTRNVHYLVRPDDPRIMRDIAAYVVREISY